MPKPPYIELGDEDRIDILYEDRSVLAIDKPAGWMLVPLAWQKTDRNLQTAIASSIAEGAFWASSRNLKFLRNIHRLDGDTSGILLFGKSMGAVQSLGRLFESRSMKKAYLVLVEGIPKQEKWDSQLKIGPDPNHIGKIKVDPRNGKEAETYFTLLASHENRSLLLAEPHTGRTHQIRVHLAADRLPIVGDRLYGGKEPISEEFPLALRAIALSYQDPFIRRPVRISAPLESFLRATRLPNPEALSQKVKGLIRPQIRGASPAPAKAT